MAKEDDSGNCIVGCVGVILFFIVIIGLVFYWMIILPAIAIIIIIIYFKYRDKKYRVKKTKFHRLKGEKKVDWIIRMTESANKCREMKIQMMKREKESPKPISEPNICPDCNVELNVLDKCELCGWEWKKCKWWNDKWKKCTWWGKKVYLEFCRECKEYKPKEDVQEHKMYIHEEDIQKQEKRSRRISQRVKNEVWRRDQGRCVKCESRLNLEYDHIIPFSKGGSNTARNIELLCEKCNRKKYNNI